MIKLLHPIEPPRRHNLVDLIPGWTDFYPKKEAVHKIIWDMFMRSNIARGKGRHAKQRLKAMRKAIRAQKAADDREAQAYACGYGDGLRDAKLSPNGADIKLPKYSVCSIDRSGKETVREVFGVVKPTNECRRTFLHIDSTGQRLEEF